MIIKTIFKSHFKIKKNFSKNLSKFIFVKNMVIFLLFSKIFLLGCNTTLLFGNLKKNQINILKAPSRHKKFFHQIFFEYFFVKVFFKFKFNLSKNIYLCCVFFKKLDLIFQKIGSNTLTRIKISTSFKIDLNKFYFLIV